MVTRNEVNINYLRESITTSQVKLGSMKALGFCDFFFKLMMLLTLKYVILFPLPKGDRHPKIYNQICFTEKKPKHMWHWGRWVCAFSSLSILLFCYLHLHHQVLFVSLITWYYASCHVTFVHFWVSSFVTFLYLWVSS